MVQALHFGVVSQQVQALAVGLPQELHPGSQKQAVSTILSVLSTYSTQKHTEKSQKFNYNQVRMGELIKSVNFY